MKDKIISYIKKNQKISIGVGIAILGVIIYTIVSLIPKKFNITDEDLEDFEEGVDIVDEYKALKGNK